VSFAPDGRTLASTSIENAVRLWDVESRQALGRPLIAHSFGVLSADFSPHGGPLASGGDDGLVGLWNPIIWDRPGERARRLLCRIAGRNLSRREWRQFASGLPYHRTCPEL
jgi:hypothetical protein